MHSICNIHFRLHSHNRTSGIMVQILHKHCFFCSVALSVVQVLSTADLPLCFLTLRKATNMQSLFEGCTYLSIPYGQGLPSSVTNASRMFANCRNLSDISSFDMKNGKLQNAESMFENTV